MRVQVNPRHRQAQKRRPRKAHEDPVISKSVLVGGISPGEPHRPDQIHGLVSLRQWMMWARWQTREIMVGDSGAANAERSLRRDLQSRSPDVQAEVCSVSVATMQDVRTGLMKVSIAVKISRAGKEDLLDRVTFSIKDSDMP